MFCLRLSRAQPDAGAYFHLRALTRSSVDQQLAVAAGRFLPIGHVGLRQHVKCPVVLTNYNTENDNQQKNKKTTKPELQEFVLSTITCEL